MLSSGESSQSRNQTRISCGSCIASVFFFCFFFGRFLNLLLLFLQYCIGFAIHQHESRREAPSNSNHPVITYLFLDSIECFVYSIPFNSQKVNKVSMRPPFYRKGNQGFKKSATKGIKMVE